MIGQGVREHRNPSLARLAGALAGAGLAALSGVAAAAVDQPANPGSGGAPNAGPPPAEQPAPPPPPPGSAANPIRIKAGPPADGRAAAYMGAASSYLVEVGLSKSQVLDVHYPYSDLMIADAKVADVIPLSNHSVYIVGKGLGSTSLSVYGANKHLIAAVNVAVGPDVEGFKARLHEVLPEESDVAARMANQSLLLSGAVTSPAALHQILDLADTYSPGKVVNMLAVEGTQQVMLSVRFVEMQRSTAKELNVTITGTNSGNPAFAGAAGPAANFNSTKPALTPFLIPSTSYGAMSMIINGNIGLEVDALETKGMLRTLAEPSLVAMSGDTASFLAGGEIPVPVPQAGAVNGGFVTIEYKNFGISLAFTPTILKDGLINLVVRPEVSSLDNSSGVNLNGAFVPGLKVRRANTTVELRDGESFTIAGLLADNYRNTITQFPFLGDVPILGALLRSPNFEEGKSELVIIVTPHLVTARKGPVALPSDHMPPPSDLELFLFGSVSGSHPGVGAEDRALMSRDPTKGGVDGPYGHVLY